MTSFAHTGSTFEKNVGHDICRIQSSIHWRKLRIYIAYSSGEIKLCKFQWRHSRIPEVHVLLKKLFGMIYAEFNSLFTGAYWAYILLIAAEKFNFEHFNDVIRAYRKYFRKRCLHTKCAEFDFVLTAINCASIWWAVIEIFAFKAVFDVISAIFLEPEVLSIWFEKPFLLFTFDTSCANFSSLALIVASESWCENNNNNNNEEGTAESVKGQRAVAPLTLIIDSHLALAGTPNHQPHGSLGWQMIHPESKQRMLT